MATFAPAGGFSIDVSLNVSPSLGFGTDRCAISDAVAKGRVIAIATATTNGRRCFISVMCKNPHLQSYRNPAPRIPHSPPRPPRKLVQLLDAASRGIPAARRLAMSIAEKLGTDIITAMKAHEEHRLTTLRMVKSALRSKEIDKRQPLTDAEQTQSSTRSSSSATTRSRASPRATVPNSPQRSRPRSS